jgi:hypothetical protein
MRRLEVADLSLAALDALAIDVLLVWVGPGRPLQGLAGLVDWRLCGALTRALKDGLFLGAPGEALLLPPRRRLPARRVLAVGHAALAADGLAEAVRGACEVVRRAGGESLAAALPAAPVAPEQAARAWLEASQAGPQRQVLLGDARALLRDLAAAREALGLAVEIASMQAPAGPVVP